MCVTIKIQKNADDAVPTSVLCASVFSRMLGIPVTTAGNSRAGTYLAHEETDLKQRLRDSPLVGPASGLTFHCVAGRLFCWGAHILWGPLGIFPGLPNREGSGWREMSLLPP